MTTFPWGLTNFKIWASVALESMFPIQTVDFKLEDVEDEEVDELEDESDVAILILICKRHQSHSQELNQEIQDNS